MAQYTFRFQYRTGGPERAGEGGASPGVGPERVRSLASMALPVARHSGFCKFKEFKSRARTQAHAGRRGTRRSYRFASDQS